MYRINSISLVMLLCCSCLAGKAQDIGFRMNGNLDHTEIPFDNHNNLVVIQLVLNKTLPLKFILDSGVKTTILTDRMITDVLRVQYDNQVKISTAGEVKEITAYLAEKVNLSLPGVTGTGQTLLVLEKDYLELKKYFGFNVHGIIGHELFRSFVVEVDYVSGQVILHDPSRFRRARSFTSLPMKVEHGKPYVECSIELPDSTVLPLRMLVDLGASHALLIETSRQPGIRVPDKHLHTSIGKGLGGDITGDICRIPGFNLGPFRFRDVICSMTGEYYPADSTQSVRRDGTIGGDILSRFRVIFDYGNERLLLKPNNGYRKPFEFDMSGLVLSVEGDDIEDYTIVEVMKDSPAAAAGLKAGDVVISINGNYYYELSLDEMLFDLRAKEGRLIRMMVKRGGEVISASFRLKRLL